MKLFTFFTCFFLQRTSQLFHQPTATTVSEEAICVSSTHRVERLTYSLHQHLSRPASIILSNRLTFENASSIGFRSGE